MGGSTLALVHGRQVDGAQVFYEADDYGSIAYLLTIAPAIITFGSATQDVDIKFFLGASNQHIVFDAGSATATFTGVDVEISGDLDISGEDISVDQGQYIWLDGMAGGEYIRSDTAGDLMVNATTTFNIAMGGTDEYSFTATAVDFNSNNITGLGTVAGTGAITISPGAAGTFLDFALETEWVSGTLINADFGGATTFSDNVVGISLDFSTNVTMTTDDDVTGYQVLLPAFTQSAANTTAIIGYEIRSAGAIVQDTAAGTINWTGVQIPMPDQTEGGGGTVTAIGLNIDQGTITSGTAFGISTGASTSGLDVRFFGDTAANYFHWDASGDDLLLVGTATQFAVAGTTDASSSVTGSIRTAGGLGVAMKAYIGTDLHIVAGNFVLSAAAMDVVVKADTANALEFYDSTTKFIDMDTRVTVTGVANITMTGMPATVAQGAGFTHQLLALVPGTTTITNGTGVTDIQGMALNISRPTITSADTPAVALTSTVYIENSPLAAGTATITAGYALNVAAGTSLFSGLIQSDVGGLGYSHTGTLAGGSTINAMALTIIDDAAWAATNYGRALYINYTNTGVKSTGSTESNGIGVDVDASADVTFLYGISLYTGAMNAASVSRAAAIAIYNDVVTGTVVASNCLYLGMNGGATYDDFIAIRSFTGTQDAIISDRSGGATAADFLVLNGINAPAYAGGAGAATMSGGWVYLRVNFNSQEYKIPCSITLTNT